MSAMETSDLPVVLPSSTSAISLALHPLPIMNISEHLTRLRLQKNTSVPFIIGALLGTQNGREVEIVNTFELAMEADEQLVDHAFLVSRKESYKQVFPSLELIGWYTVAAAPTSRHIDLHTQFVQYTPTPILLLLDPSADASDASGALPFRAYEPTMEIREGASRNVYIEATYRIETGEAERIAVDWTSKEGAGGTSLEAHLQTQRAAVKMLYDRQQLLVKYLTDVASGKAPKDHIALRSLSSLIASLPASDSTAFRDEFDDEYANVQLTAYLSTLTKAANEINDLVDKHSVMNASSREERMPMAAARRRMGRGGFPSDWERFH